MAAIFDTANRPDRTQPSVPSPTAKPAGPLVRLARLAELHDEIGETSQFAILLGRAPYAAGALTLCAALAGALSDAPIAARVASFALVAAAVGAIARAYRQAVAVPFAREKLQIFARDLAAIMLYAGFAWGAGAFLVLPADATLAATLLFGAGAGAALAVIFRAWDIVAWFIVPVTALSLFAALIRPLEVGMGGPAAILAAGLAVGGLAWLLESLSRPTGLPRSPGVALRRASDMVLAALVSSRQR